MYTLPVRSVGGSRAVPIPIKSGTGTSYIVVLSIYIPGMQKRMRTKLIGSKQYGTITIINSFALKDDCTS